MTLTVLLDMTRAQYNAGSDSFFTDMELIRYAWAGCQELAREANLIEGTDTTPSIASTQSYPYPTSAISIKRVTYNGRPLKPINLREDYAISLDNAATTTTGTPQFYYLWNGSIYLRPIPDTSSLTIQIYSFKEATLLTSVSDTIPIPTLFHANLVDYLLSRMYTKDGDPTRGQMYFDVWEKNGIMAAKRWARKRLRGDQFAGVQDEDQGPMTVLGKV